MKTKARRPPPPQTYSKRRELFERAIVEADEAYRHLKAMEDALSYVAIAPAIPWQRRAKHLAELTQQLRDLIEPKLRMLGGIDDAEELLDPDEGFEPEPEAAPGQRELFP